VKIAVHGSPGVSGIVILENYMTRRIVCFKVLLLTVAVAQLLDVISTNRSLAAGRGLYESNPLMRLTMAEFGTAWWLPKLAIAAFLTVLALRMKRPSPRELPLTAFVVTAYFTVLANNFLR
jgi:uncharacterized membrane protein